MKKIISFVLVLIICFTLFAACGNKATDNEEETLRIYNWEDYMEMEVLDDFKAYYDAKYNTDLKIKYETFDTNETMLTKIEKAHESYDLACPSEYIIERMVQKDLVIPLDNSIVAEIYNKNVPNYIRDKYSRVIGNTEDTLYSIGYMWGTLGILYNKNEIPQNELEEKGWGILWDTKYSGKIFMKDSIRDTVAVANLYTHEKEYNSLKQQYLNNELSEKEYSTKIESLFNDTSDETCQLVEKALKEQKKSCDIMYDVDNDKNAMVNGTSYLDVAWSGDAVWAIIEAEEANNDVHLGYYIPSSGTNVWFDGWVIPKYAKNTRAANEFIAFSLDPQESIKIMDYIGYTSVVGTPEILEYSKEMAFEEDQNANISYFFEGADSVTLNSTMYPNYETIISASIMRDYGKDSAKMSELWMRVKGNSVSPIIIVLIASILIALIVIAIYRIIIKRKKTQKQQHKRNTYTP